MSGKLLLDTNIILGFLRGHEAVVKYLQAHEGHEWYASVITRMELLSFHSLEKEDENAVQEFLGTVIIVPLSPEVEDMAIRLRRATRRKMPDAIVAASAVVSGAMLVTKDRELAATDFFGLMTHNPNE